MVGESVREAHLKKSLGDLDLSHEGRVQIDTWRQFVVNFQNLLTEMGGMSEEACYDKLWEKLPQGMRNWLSEEEFEREGEQPPLEISLPIALNDASFARLVAKYSGKPPKEVEILGENRWKVMWEEKDKEPYERMLALNGHFLRNQGGGQLRVQAVEYRMSVQEVLSFLTDKLEMVERKHMRMPKGGQRQDRTERHARVVSNTPTEKRSGSCESSASRTSGGESEQTAPRKPPHNPPTLANVPRKGETPIQGKGNTSQSPYWQPPSHRVANKQQRRALFQGRQVCMESFRLSTVASR